MFDVEGYEPDWQHGAAVLHRTHGQRLEDLVGRRLSACWLVWDASDDSWFADAPVVLDFEGVRLEICHHKFDEIDIAWNRIDLTRPIPWKYENDGPMPLSWRDDRRVDLEQFRGEVLRECALKEWVGEDIAYGMVAVEFTFETGRFIVANGLDENQIAIGPADPRYRTVE